MKGSRFLLVWLIGLCISFIVVRAVAADAAPEIFSVIPEAEISKPVVVKAVHIFDSAFNNKDRPALRVRLESVRQRASLRSSRMAEAA